MIDRMLFDDRTAWLAGGLRQHSAALTRQWLDRVERLFATDPRHVVVSHQMSQHMPALITHIASFLQDSRTAELAEGSLALQTASELGALRYRQHATIDQVLREYELLDEVVGAFVEQEVSSSTMDAVSLVAAMRRVSHVVGQLQRRTLVAFVAEYLNTIERQTEQLRKFSRLVSHEIRQPLAVLQVVARALPTRIDDADAARMMDLFTRNVARLTEVTGKLERLARVTRATDLSLQDQDVELAGLVSGVAKELADMAAARDVQVLIRPNLPVVRTDPARAALIFINLIANAIKYSDPGKAERFVEIYGVAGDPASVIVRDNGIGIPSDRLQHIFREFVRAHSHRDDEIGPRGLGFGLSIVRESMDAANGSVRVESIQGKGTTFKLTWPLR